MKFGVLLAPDNLTQLGHRARMSERLGFDYIGISDSQSLLREIYVSLSAVAVVTSRVHIGSTVSNPLTRHPAVTASAIASVNELSGGRAFLGISSGNASVLNVELQPAHIELAGAEWRDLLGRSVEVHEVRLDAGLAEEAALISQKEAGI